MKIIINLITLGVLIIGLAIFFIIYLFDKREAEARARASEIELNQNHNRIEQVIKIPLDTPEILESGEN